MLNYYNSVSDVTAVRLADFKILLCTDRQMDRSTGFYSNLFTYLEQFPMYRQTDRQTDRKGDFIPCKIEHVFS